MASASGHCGQSESAVRRQPREHGVLEGHGVGPTAADHQGRRSRKGQFRIAAGGLTGQQAEHRAESLTPAALQRLQRLAGLVLPPGLYEETSKLLAVVTEHGRRWRKNVHGDTSPRAR